MNLRVRRVTGASAMVAEQSQKLLLDCRKVMSLIRTGCVDGRRSRAVDETEMSQCFFSKNLWAANLASWAKPDWGDRALCWSFLNAPSAHRVHALARWPKRLGVLACKAHVAASEPTLRYSVLRTVPWVSTYIIPVVLPRITSTSLHHAARHGRGAGIEANEPRSPHRALPKTVPPA
jgi:hypothetical protein